MATLFTTTGAVIRWNIVHVDNYLADRPFHDPVMWAARITQVVLAGAYAVSVAYYLKLLADFAMKPLAVPEAWHVLISNIDVTAIIGVLMMLAFSGGLRPNNAAPSALIEPTTSAPSIAESTAVAT